MTTTGLFDGSATTATVISIQDGGDGIWGTVDTLHYYYTEPGGDFNVVVQNADIDNVESWTKAGPMVCESLDPDSKNVVVRRRPNGEASVQYRPEDGAETDSVGGTPADWLRLKRSGDAIETYRSTDGETWTPINTLDTADVPLSDSVCIGLAVTSHLPGTLATATFRSLSGVDPDRNHDIGDIEVAGSMESTVGVPLISTGDVTDIGPGSATLTDDLGDLGGADSAECYFEYRKVPTGSWKTTDSAELTSSGAFNVDADDLTRRRYYEVRAVAGTVDGDIARSSVPTLNTPNPLDSRAPAHPGPDNASHFGPSDGFAEAAPWLDDDTPVIVITEPTHRQLEEAITIDGERLVVFETSGTIDLGVCDLPIPYDKCYIADQTAPSLGVTLVKGRVSIGASGYVLQHIRVRLGDANIEDATEGWALDTVSTADETMNNVIDRISASWSIDECLSIGYETAETTVSNCLIAEALDDSVHPEGEHGYGSLIGNSAKSIVMLGNVWAFNTDRHPRLKEGTQSVVVNSVMYGFKDGTWLDPDIKASIVGSAYLRPNSDKANISIENDVDITVIYLEGSLTDNDAAMVDENVIVVDERPSWPDGLTAVSSDRTFDHNLANVGARPAGRAATNGRTLENVEDGGSYLVDSQRQVGGYPGLPVSSHELNIPNGGTRPWLRSWSRRVETPQR